MRGGSIALVGAPAIVAMVIHEYALYASRLFGNVTPVRVLGWEYSRASQLCAQSYRLPRYKHNHHDFPAGGNRRHPQSAHDAAQRNILRSGFIYASKASATSNSRGKNKQYVVSVLLG
jgi:hypothetical protein